MIQFRKTAIRNNIRLIDKIDPDMQSFCIISSLNFRDVFYRSALIGKPFFEDRIVFKY